MTETTAPKLNRAQRRAREAAKRKPGRQKYDIVLTKKELGDLIAIKLGLKAE